jgi:hypothetical protein
MRDDVYSGHAVSGRLGISRISVGRTSTALSTEDLPHPGWSRTSLNSACSRARSSYSTPRSRRSVGAAVECPETVGQFRSTNDLQLGERLL